MFSRETVAELIASALGCGVAPIVRVRSHDDPDMTLFLDAGALGIIVPDVSDAEQARRVVAACQFPPLGGRSLPGPLIHSDFQAPPAREAMDGDIGLLLSGSQQVVASVRKLQAG